MRRRLRLIRPAIAALLLAGCDGAADARVDAAAGADAALDAAVPGDDAGGELPPFPKELAPTSALGAAGPWEIARAAVHFHTPLSHDACDGEGWIDGVVDEPCLQQMRRGICLTRQDVVFATDHDAFHADVAFPDVFLMREGDEMVHDRDGVAIGATIGCPDGTRPVLVTGEENELMPIGLRRHPGEPGSQALHELYDSAEPEAAERYREVGAVVVIPHSEHWTADAIEATGAEAMELYNFHANLDRDIREQHLGLPPDDAIAAVLVWVLEQAEPEPDLAFTSFLEENRVDLALFDALHARGVRITGLLGNDVHQNTMRQPLSDGERPDSYRRLLRWMSNYLLVAERSPEAALEAIRAGRVYAAFDGLGTPLGFDFRAEDGCGDRTEMGGTAPLECDPVLKLDVPEVHDLAPSLDRPIVRATILRVGEGEPEVLVAGAEGTLELAADRPGVYRAVVTITPEHWRPYFNGVDERYVRELIWVYGNPIHVE